MQEPIPRERLIHAILDSGGPAQFLWRKGESEARGHHRAEFRFSCGVEVVDTFFNSASGMRAHYYGNIESGQEFTRFMLMNLSDRLLSKCEFDSVPGGRNTVRLSLLANSAKIWIDEDASTLDKSSVDAEKLIALEVPHWVKAARRAAAAFAAERQPKPSVQEKALLGVQVPRVEGIGVFGAWLRDQDLIEFEVPSKRNRPRHIRAYGFS